MTVAVTYSATARGIAARRTARLLLAGPPELQTTTRQPTTPSIAYDPQWKAIAERYRQQVAAMTVPACEPARKTSYAIIAEVAEKHGITVFDIRSHSRGRRLVLARQEAMWRISRELGRSLAEVGRVLGGRDHTTALHGIRQHEARMVGGAT